MGHPRPDHYAEFISALVFRWPRTPRLPLDSIAAARKKIAGAASTKKYGPRGKPPERTRCQM